MLAGQASARAAVRPLAAQDGAAEADNADLAQVFAAYTLSATAWLLFATFVAIIIAYKFGAPDFAPGAWLTFGRHGMTVGGVRYASQMPPFGAQLSDQDVADLIDYERSAWGNHGRPVTPAEVTAIRAHGQ